jgi:drug/metabolite transporter (DMT)-like permease
MLVAVSFFASNLLLIKILTLIDPTVSPFLLITLRSVSSLCLLTPIAMLQAKNSIQETLLKPFKKFGPLTFFLSFGGIAYEIMICYVCVRVLPIVNVSIFINMAPLFTVLLAVPILGETLSVFNIVQTVVSFAGVLLIVLGRDFDPQVA